MEIGEQDSNKSIRPAVLVGLYNIGFKLIPLAEDSKTPCVKSTNEIYNNPNYWTPERLIQEAPNFKNVATTFGQNITGKRLNELDIDSQKVYDMLFSTSSFIDDSLKNTYVVKTKKPFGYRIFWLSEKQNKAIGTKDCRPGYEFEIKTDNTLGHSTLPPSRHRDDPDFHYKNYGQDKIGTQDEVYDKLVNLLSDCLKSEADEAKDKRTAKGLSPIFLSNENVKKIYEIIYPHYLKDHRHDLVFALSGLLHKCSVSEDSTLELIQLLADADEERSSRLRVVSDTYGKDPSVVNGNERLLEVLEHAIGDKKHAKKTLDKIFQIILEQTQDDHVDHVVWLGDVIMKEHTFKTTTDNEELYWYNGTKYVVGQEWIIKQLCQLMFASIRTNTITEVTNHIKRATYINRSLFDSNPDELSLLNGVLNIRTGKFRPHSSTDLLLVQLPITYKAKARCPNFARFLNQILKPEDVSTVLQFIGYCLYRSAKFEKALLCIGKGDNGKSTLLGAIERFLGKDNVSNKSLQDLAENRFSSSSLYCKLANTFADLKKEKILNTGPFKMLVSGDRISAEKKHRDSFEFENYAKLIFSCNEIPESDDNTYAYFKRWIIVHFEHIFAKDITLIDRISTDEEKSGLLNLALISLRRLLKDNEFSYNADIEEVRDDYNYNSSSVEQFLINKCEITKKPTDYIICRDLWSVYLDYCKDKKLEAKYDNVFGMELQQLHIKKDRIRVNKSLEYCYVGVKLKEVF